nr:hypothetical protein [Natronorubrum sediminis]
MLASVLPQRFSEVVPKTYARGHERMATLGTMAGVIVMLFLDVTLG